MRAHEVADARIGDLFREAVDVRLERIPRRDAIGPHDALAIDPEQALSRQHLGDERLHGRITKVQEVAGAVEAIARLLGRRREAACRSRAFEDAMRDAAPTQLDRGREPREARAEHHDVGRRCHPSMSLLQRGFRVARSYATTSSSVRRKSFPPLISARTPAAGSPSSSTRSTALPDGSTTFTSNPTRIATKPPSAMIGPVSFVFQASAPSAIEYAMTPEVVDA